MLLNLNADVGESFGDWPMGNDNALLPLINSANVACGFHAGDPSVISRTLRLAVQHGVSVGAHPGFPDLQGFGRRPMTLSDSELRNTVLYQLAVMDGMARCHGTTMTHVKPHGAMNNMACENPQMAGIIAQAIHDFNPQLILMAPALSALAHAAAEAQLTVALEVFADRAYTDTGALVSRRLPGAVLPTSTLCIEHVRRMIEAQGIVTQSGQVLSTAFHSICVHGDNTHAVDTARQIRDALTAEGHQLSTLPDVVQGS